MRNFCEVARDLTYAESEMYDHVRRRVHVISKMGAGVSRIKEQRKSRQEGLTFMPGNERILTMLRGRPDVEQSFTERDES